MLTAQATVDLFQTPVAGSPLTERVRKAFLRASSRNGDQALAARRALSILFDTDLAAILGGNTENVTITDLQGSDLENASSAQFIIDNMAAHSQTIRLTIDEAGRFLPLHTVEVLREYDTEGSPLERLGVGLFVVLAALLQD